MPDKPSDNQAQRLSLSAIATFVGSLMPSARMMALYKPDHPLVLQIAERSRNVLLKTLGQETTLVVDVKGKTVSYGEQALADSKDIAQFGSTLHTLGIGQVLFTNRLAKEGMRDLLRILVLKPDDAHPLTAIQQELQKTKIDGLQMTFILSFVATGENEEAAQIPGQLTEEQVSAFIRAETLPDFLILLLRQAEGFRRKAGRMGLKISDYFYFPTVQS